MMFRRKKGWKARLKRIAIAAALVAIGLTVYGSRFHPEQEDLPGQRAQLAKRERVATTPRIDAGVLMADLKVLSDPAMEGRKVGTPGGARARAYLLQRYRQIGLEPVGAGFEQPFSFTPGRGIRFWRGTFWKTPQPVSGVNLIGSVAGTSDPGQVIVISAHYDHLGVRNGKVYTGADDNASGVAAMLAVATWFRAHPPRHTMLFVAFDGEEAGLRGARAFLEQPPVPAAQILANINFDMLSRSKPGEIFVTGLWANPQLRATLEPLRTHALPTVLYGHDYPRPFWNGDDWTLQSDQGVFAQKDIAFLYFGVEDHPDYHQPSDRFEKIDLPFYPQVADLVTGAVVAVDAMPSDQIRHQP
jgi:hypothetical protein